MQRSKRSFFNAIAAMAQTIGNGLLGMVVTRLILVTYGSDFNGLNSAVTQVVSMLLVLEGGFTLATNVALFAPYSEGDRNKVNGILSATDQIFKRVGLLFLLIGALIAVGYSLFANSALPRFFIFIVTMMAILAPAFNFYYATKYRILLQAEQKEYIISWIKLMTLVIGHFANIGAILMGAPMWVICFNMLALGIINSLLLAGAGRKNFPHVEFAVPPATHLIKGTSDVLAQKITGIIYNTAPIVFLSISSYGGMVLASVYAVYNNVFIMIKSLMYAVIDAPRLGLGQMLSEKGKDAVWPVFAQYELVVFMLMFILLTTAYTLIQPFIALYTHGVTDTNYVQPSMAILFVLISCFELIHIPSGHMINMSGNFRISKNIQVITCVILIIAMAAGGAIFGIYGLLCAVLLAAVLLSILEMVFIHGGFFQRKMRAMSLLILPFMLGGGLMCYLETLCLPAIPGYGAFLLCGIALVIINSIGAIALGYLFHRESLKVVFRRGLSIVRGIL